jgi:hypothetical protein
MSIFSAAAPASGVIPLSEYHRAQKLGDGAFGSVFTVYDDEGVVRALKVFDDDEDDGTMDSGTMREISILRLLREGNGHPGILRMYDAILFPAVPRFLFLLLPSDDAFPHFVLVLLSAPSLL